VRFVPQEALPAGEAYEAYIFRTRQVPTREGLHDFFNGLCWLHFPRTKTRLNALQAEQIAQSGVHSVRGAARDGITVFDENAAFFQGPDALWQALVAKDWRQLFVTLRPQWAQAQLVLFGHALIEKLVTPRKGITAHVYRVLSTTPDLAAMDAWMAQDLSAENSRPSLLRICRCSACRAGGLRTRYPGFTMMRRYSECRGSWTQRAKNRIFPGPKGLRFRVSGGLNITMWPICPLHGCGIRLSKKGDT